MKNIAVFYGGESIEHDVSVISGVLVLNSLDKEKYNAVPIYVDYDGVWYTGEILKDISTYKKLEINKLTRVSLIGGSNLLYKVKKGKIKELLTVSCAINCMHGERGEDGSLAGLLNMCKIPIASPKMLASSVCMDKSVCKTFFKGLKVKCLPCITLSEYDDFDKFEKSVEYPAIVKPATGGSSIGVKKAENKTALRKAVDFAFRYSNKVIIESLLTNFTEINCAVYKNAQKEIIVSPCERPVGETELLTFLDKYSLGKREFPANIEKKISDKIREIAKKCYIGLDLEGIVRLDFMLKDGAIYLNEINTVPGSLAYYLFCDTLKEFSNILSSLIIRAEREYSAGESLQRKYSSSVLELKGVKSSKRL